jgi:glycosyltransferase involved in cell wall biosynthesis
MASADAQLVSLRGDEFLRYTTPSKISTILASGLPIVGQIAGDGATLISASGAGVVVSPGDADTMCEAICALADLPSAERAEMGRRGRAFYDVTMSSNAAATAIVGALQTAP